MYRLLLPLIFLLSSLSFCQSSEIDSLNLRLDSLELELENGNKEALIKFKELITCDKSTTGNTFYGTNTQSVNKFAAEILNKYCSFEHLQIFREINSEEYNTFLREYYDSIRYVPSLKSFSDVNSNYNVEYRVFKLEEKNSRNRDYSNNRYFFEIKNPNLLPPFSITDTKKNIKLLQNISSPDDFSAETEKYYNDDLIFQLGYYPSDQSLGLILHILRTKEINEIQAAKNSLALITNFKLGSDTISDKFVLAQKYEDLRFEYASFEEMKKAGFKHLHINMTDSTHFYSDLLDKEDIPWWNSINALPELIRTKDSRVLPFLAKLYIRYNIQNSRILKYRSHFNFLDTLTKLTQTKIQFKNEDGGFSEYPNPYEIKWSIRLYYYWQQHYDNWSWSDDSDCFINSKLQYYQPIGLEKSIKAMTSKNDTIAFSGFIKFVDKFTLQDENIVSRDWYNILGYDKMNKNIHSSFHSNTLLSFKRFLKYCDEHNLEYQIDQAFCKKISDVIGNSEFEPNNMLAHLMLFKNQDYKNLKNDNIEQEILSIIQINQIPQLLYLQYIANNLSWDYSELINSMTKKVFQKYLNTLLSNEKYLKFYLKYLAQNKTFSNERLQQKELFVNFYKMQNTTRQLLHKIAQDCEDIEINSTAINILLNNIEPDYIFEDLPVIYLDNITEYASKKINFVPKAANYDKIVNAIQNTDDISKLKNYCTLLDRHHSIEMVPYIMRVVDDYRVYSTSIIHGQSVDLSSHWSEEKEYVSTAVISILEDLYEYSYNYNYDTKEVQKEFLLFAQKCWKPEEVAPYWKNQWKQDSLNYRDWGKVYHQQVIDNIIDKYANSDSLTRLELDIISESKFRNDSDTLIWKKLLSNLLIDDVEFLNTDSIFKISSFDQMQRFLSNKDAFIEIYERITDTTLISLDKIYHDLQNFNEVDQGEIISHLLVNNYFKNALINHPNREKLTNKYIEEKVYSFRKYYSQIEAEDDSFSFYKNALEALEQRSGSIFGTINVSNPALYFLEMDSMNFENKFQYVLLNLKGRQQRNHFFNIEDSIKYKDLPLVCKYAQQIDSISSLKYLLERLSIKLGIPLFICSLENIDSLDQILTSHTEDEYIRMSAIEFYPNLFADQKLNYSLVAEKLKSPLALKCDNYNHLEYSPTLTLIRILELEHNTRLGYEYQFDRYNPKSAQKRINAWIEYLEDKGFIDKN